MLLSICIPSYNRHDKLKKLLYSILEAQSKEFEVVIVDNCSPEVIDLSNIEDERIRFVIRKTPVSGTKNVRDVLDYGEGKYVMLCLDKDFIHGRCLDSFIEELKRIPQCTCGYCILNSLNENVEMRNGKKIINAIYRCGHPSGYFFRSDLVKKDTSFIKNSSIEDIYYEFAFVADLLYARCLLFGEEYIFNSKLVKSETLEEAAATKSYTYGKGKKDIYFLPDQRRKQLEIYVSYLNFLGIQKTLYKKIVRKILRKTMNESTLIYKEIMNNELLCKHHGLEREKINSKQMYKAAKTLVKSFEVNDSIQLTKTEKILDIAYSYLFILAKSVKISCRKNN